VALQARIQALEEHIAQMHALNSPTRSRAKTSTPAAAKPRKTPTPRGRKS